MTTIKVSTLTGPLLDLWVAKAKNMAHVFIEDGVCWQMQYGDTRCPYSPSTDWSQGGPIIEREDICLTQTGDANSAWSIHYMECTYGQTPLIAAMRLYVASKFGEEVDEA